MSDVLREFEDLPDAYRAILDSTEYQYISGSEGIVRVSRRDKNVREMRRRRQEEEEIELLGEAICAGRANDAQAVLGRAARAGRKAFRGRALGTAAAGFMAG